MANRPFGYQLMVCLYGCAQETLDDISLAYAFLEESVHVLCVSKQSQPHIFRSPDAFVDKAGLSGWVPIIESSLQIHTLIPRRFVVVEFFTCSVINRSMKKKLVQLAERYYKPEKTQAHLSQVGLDYYKD